MENKICSMCKINIVEKEGASYCKKCSLDYCKTWRENNKEHISEYYKSYIEDIKSNYIYMFIPTVEEFEGEVLNIGSTNNIGVRMSGHLTLQSKASRVMKENKKTFNVIYAEIEEDLTREELYFIEYYLIHKYYTMHGINPLGNEITTYNTDICTSRQFELILIAEGLKYKQYDVFKHKKNAFINVCGSHL